MAKYIRHLLIPKGLEDRIMLKIAVLASRRAKARFAVWTSLSFLSLVSLVPLIQIAWSQFASSGTFEYLSLALSDTGLLASYWQEFAFSIAESLPVIAVISVLVVFAILLRSALGVLQSLDIVFFTTKANSLHVSA